MCIHIDFMMYLTNKFRTPHKSEYVHFAIANVYVLETCRIVKIPYKTQHLWQLCKLLFHDVLDNLTKAGYHTI